MKRSALKRKTPLSPGEYQLKRTPLSRGDKQLERKAPLRAVARTYHRPEGELKLRADGRVEFRAKRPASTQWCTRCRWSGVTRPASEWHHWLPQQHIRTYVRGLRLSKKGSRELLHKLLRDEGNLIALCHDCHVAHESGNSRLRGEDVPHSARVFALRLGIEWIERMKRMYPGGTGWDH